MSDWPVLVQAGAAIVQAAAAVAIVGLTIRLAKANAALVKATDSYARSARDQVNELVTARLATIQPHLHLVSGWRQYAALVTIRVLRWGGPHTWRPKRRANSRA